MTKVALKINGHTYNVVCEDQEVDYLNKLSVKLDKMITDLAKSSDPNTSQSLLLIVNNLVLIDKIENQQLLDSKKTNNDEGKYKDLVIKIDKYKDRIDELINYLKKINN